MIADNSPLLRVENLVKYFPVGKNFIFNTRTQVVHAVDNVSFDIRRGETLGLVGESGCGKTTLGRVIMMLYRPTSGKILFNGEDLTGLDSKGLRRARQKMRLVFQDPYSSLDPRMTVTQIISEPLRVHGIHDRKKTLEIVAETLSLVGLGPQFINHYTHEFSGGQCQRIGLARALALAPELLICDEPISALDVSIQAQVVNLLQELQGKLGLTYLFIAHDLSMVRHISDRIAVMYLGGIAEVAPRDLLFTTPLHPYTEALLSSVPVPDPLIEKNRSRILLQGDVPSPVDPPSGCTFHTRCPYNDDQRCRLEKPSLRELAPGHFVACHLAEVLKLHGVPALGIPPAGMDLVNNHGAAPKN